MQNDVVTQCLIAFLRVSVKHPLIRLFDIYGLAMGHIQRYPCNQLMCK